MFIFWKKLQVDPLSMLCPSYCFMYRKSTAKRDSILALEP